MAEAQKRPDEVAITSASQLRGTLTWEGVRRTALDVVDNFCRNHGLNPGEFMANQGLMRSEQWRQGVNWRECVNWNQFNSIIFSAIPAEREGGSVVGRRFEQGRLTRTLSDMQESYSANATPRTEDRTAQRPAAEQRESAPQPRQQETAPAPATAQPRSQLSDATWSRLYSATETVLDSYPQLNEEQRTAIHNIMDRAGPGSRRLVAVNLTSYLRELNGTRVLNDEQATNLYNSLIGSEQRPGLAVQAEAWVREERDTRRLPEPNRLAAAEQRERPAPTRAETFVYRVSVVEPPAEEGGTARTISTFEVVSPRAIETTTDLATLVRERPEGLSVTRLGSGGRRVAIRGDGLDTFGNRMNQLRFDPNHEVVITETQKGTART